MLLDEVALGNEMALPDRQQSGEEHFHAMWKTVREIDRPSLVTGV